MSWGPGDGKLRDLKREKRLVTRRYRVSQMSCIFASTGGAIISEEGRHCHDFLSFPSLDVELNTWICNNDTKTHAGQGAGAGGNGSALCSGTAVTTTYARKHHSGKISTQTGRTSNALRLCFEHLTTIWHRTKKPIFIKNVSIQSKTRTKVMPNGSQ